MMKSDWTEIFSKVSKRCRPKFYSKIGRVTVLIKLTFMKIHNKYNTLGDNPRELSLASKSLKMRTGTGLKYNEVEHKSCFSSNIFSFIND